MYLAKKPRQGREGHKFLSALTLEAFILQHPVCSTQMVSCCSFQGTYDHDVGFEYHPSRRTAPAAAAATTQRLSDIAEGSEDQAEGVSENVIPGDPTRPRMESLAQEDFRTDTSLSQVLSLVNLCFS